MNNKKLRKILIKMNISSNLKANIYIQDAIKILDSQRIHTSMNTIYSMISEKRDISNYGIERAIRYAIVQAYKKNKKIQKIYNEVPNNSAFLYDIAFNFDIFEEEFLKEEK